MRYVSKPTEVEAIQWTGDNVLDVLSFMGSNGVRTNPHQTDADARLLLLAGQDGAQGWVPVPVGHWIVRQSGDLTDHWPNDPDYFARKYEAAAGFALNPPSYEDPEETVTLTCRPCNISYQYTGDAGSCAEEAGEFRLGHGGCTA